MFSQFLQPMLLNYSLCCPNPAFSAAESKFRFLSIWLKLAGLDGLELEYFQLLVFPASHVVFVLAIDASFSGSSRGHHPITCKFML